MKKLFMIQETEKTLDQTKEKIDFTSGIFVVDSPFTKNGFQIKKDGYYYKIKQEKGDHAAAFDYNVTLIKNRKEYEEFSEELNNWDLIIEDKIIDKFPKAKYIHIKRNEIYIYNYHPYFIWVEFEMRNEIYELIDNDELKYEILPNNLEFETV